MKLSIEIELEITWDSVPSNDNAEYYDNVVVTANGVEIPANAFTKDEWERIDECILDEIPEYEYEYEDN